MAEEEKPQEPEQKSEPSGAQARIAQLTRRFRDAERDKGNLEQENARLSDQLMRLSERVDTLAKPPEPKRSDPFSPPPSAAPENVQDLVKQAVSEALAPLQEAQKASAQAQELQSAQRVSFHEAAKHLPEVLEAGSETQTLFDQLWQASPALQADPDGPAKVIMMTRGALTDGARSGRKTEKRKQAASPPAPGSPQQRLSDLPDQESAIKQRLDQLRGKDYQDSNGSLRWTQDEMNEYIRLKVAESGSGMLKPPPR